ncbi:MAG: transketolase, partial [Dehalococcoidia bacterium]|nr:transketolase [Dehalococcoidia bacterium]
IGYGSPNKAGTASAHGEPLGKAETLLTKQHLDWPYSEPFTVPENVLQHFRAAVENGKKKESEWQNLFEAYGKAYPAEAGQFKNAIAGKLPSDWDDELNNLFDHNAKPLATREASGIVLNALAAKIPALMGGSADLAPSTKTLIKGSGDFAPPTYAGRNLRFGIREHAMGAIAHGLALHGGIIPYTATFLMFYDYMRASVRLSSLTEDRVIFLFTHDSIGLGEDGPTHQPIEQLTGLRSVPGLVTIRPADASETAEAWKLALSKYNGPTALVLTRQAVPTLNRTVFASADGVQHGGYVLWQTSENPQILLIATGSEVHIALEAATKLKEHNIASRVVSMPSWEVFEAQNTIYKHSVLPPHIKARISIEAGLTFGWCRYTGEMGVNMGIDRFGASAPGNTLYAQFGITAAKVIEAAIKMLNAC